MGCAGRAPAGDDNRQLHGYTAKSDMTTEQILAEYFASQSDKAKGLGETDSLLERGLLDSMAIVKLISFLEDRFGVQLSDEEFDPDNFETLKAIGALVEAKRPKG